MITEQIFRRLLVLFFITITSLLFMISYATAAAVVDLTSYQKKGLHFPSVGLMSQIIENEKPIPGSQSRGKNWGREISIVKLKGKINHFGYDITQDPPKGIDYHATVSDVQVWIDEYPFTREFDIRSDETGWWRMYIIKYKDVDLEFSFIYEKKGWITTKTNAITITDEDRMDLAIQYIDPWYYHLAIKPNIEEELSEIFPYPIELENALVVTVGKSWASMHDDRLPHGDPGATTVLTPEVYFPAIGPIYFNRRVQPDPVLTETSVDGGVAYINIPTDTYHVTANKPGVEYETVKFYVTEEDEANGVVLYIASPPDSVQGDNDSGPGDY